MIVDRESSHFIFVVPRRHFHGLYNYINYRGKDLTNHEYLDHWGKWIVFGPAEELAELAKKIDPYVEENKIPAAKYDREKINEFKLGECVMCIYCDERQREDVWQILSSLGVDEKMWVFERETLERWMPGGHLLERWISGKRLSLEQAERVRDGAREKFKKMFEDPNAVFKGIDQ
ncbi:MAG: hypothetical protein HQK56_01990 [Deltaproteobacteria bacterium]|nr:hypothetical protein [Deltaproteobacteria bacterium]